MEKFIANLQNLNRIDGKINITIHGINVDGDVNLSGIKMSKIPFKFNIVTGSFDCSNCDLESFENCPVKVGDFDGSGNLVKSLKNIPHTVEHFIILSNLPNVKDWELLDNINVMKNKIVKG